MSGADRGDAADEDGENLKLIERRGETRGLETLARSAEVEAIARDAVPAGTHIGRYLVLSCLEARGGLEVYAAFDPELDRRVALKLLRPGDTGANGTLPMSIPGSTARSTAQARLLREAQAMAKLAHQRSRSCTTWVPSETIWAFVAMELVDGGTLRDRLKSRPGRAELLRLLLDAGEGLAAAHDAGLVHRDFKPDNVLVGKDGRARRCHGLRSRPRDARPRAGGRRRRRLGRERHCSAARERREDSSRRPLTRLHKR